MQLTREQDNFITVLSGIKIAFETQSVWGTSDYDLIKVAEDLVLRGWAIEVTPRYVTPEDSDRCFQLTVKGQHETDFLTVS